MKSEQDARVGGKRCRSRYLKFYCYEALISKNIVNYKAHEEILKR